MTNYNPYSLGGKTILITGASSGIGRATAIECSKMGAKCIITGRNQERLQETFDQLEGEGHLQIIADLSIQEEIEKLVEQLPDLDGVVNNAGINIMKPLSFVRIDDLELIYHTNTFAPILLIKNVIRKKKLKNNASLVFTASIAAFESTLGNSIYGTSKAAVEAFMRYCARELSGKLIRSNAVLPAMVETNLIANSAVSEEQHEIDKLRYPLKRYGKPEDIAWAIIYLLSDASSWVTGHSLILDGGKTLV